MSAKRWRVGSLTSLELFDRRDESLAQFLAERRDEEPAVWRHTLAALSLDEAHP